MRAGRPGPRSSTATRSYTPSASSPPRWPGSGSVSRPTTSTRWAAICSPRSPPRRCGGGAARGAWVGSLAVPPVSRPIPRFIADASVEGLPYGRWGQRLRDELAKACEPHISEAGGPPGEVTWFPERAWGGRIYVPAVAPVEGAQTPSEYFGLVSLVRPPEGEGGEAGNFEARADFTDVTADQNPDW